VSIRPIFPGNLREKARVRSAIGLKVK